MGLALKMSLKENSAIMIARVCNWMKYEHISASFWARGINAVLIYCLWEHAGNANMQPAENPRQKELDQGVLPQKSLCADRGSMETPSSSEAPAKILRNATISLTLPKEASLLQF